MRALALYLLLVGLPVVALLGVLRVGEGLRAPPSVGGGWKLLLAPDASECTRQVLGGATAPLAVVQSGRYLEVTLGRLGVAEGRLHGESLVVEDGSAGGRLRFELRSRVRGGSRASGLEGTLILPACGARGAASFSASRG